MALYRRFAVYFYQYQGEKKGASAGFGMIELRDRRVRMQITGRGSGIQSPMEVYGLLDAPEEMSGIHLGTMQSGRFSYEADMELTGKKTFQDFRGIVLCRRPGAERTAAALWEGRFHAGKFHEWQPSSSETVQSDWEEAEMERSSTKYIPTEGEEIAQKTQPEETVETAEQNKEKEIRESDEFLKMTNADFEQEQESMRGLYQEETPDQEKEEDRTRGSEPNSEEAEGLKFSATSLSECVSSVKRQSAMDQISIPRQIPFAADILETSNQKEEPIPLRREEQRENCSVETPEETKNESAEESMPLRESFLWKRIFLQYPKMKVYLYGEVLCVLRIRPCDINRLPKADWKYGCSHFLARHYNRYRCLILGRRQAGNRWQYFLGVPGNHTPSEEEDALKVGFGTFVLSEQHVKGWPEGYWIAELEWDA